MRVVLVLIALLLPFQFARAQDFTGDESFVSEVVRITNIERTHRGLRVFYNSMQLNSAAQAHAWDMASQNYFSHISMDGRTTWQRIYGAGYVFRTAGENIAAGYATPAAVVAGWMSSTAHRANILNASFYDIGVGYAYNPGASFDHYWVQDFGTRK